MISRRLKQSYYGICRPLMALNAWWYRRFRAPRCGCVRVHLGPGQRKYLPGWINVDSNVVTAHIDVWANLLDGLPFPDNSVDAFYSHHVIEHLPDHRLPQHFSEMHRCLRPGGMIRIGGPNGDAAIRKFCDGDASWFGDYPDRRTSIGGRFANFVLCRGEHLTILTASYLQELAEQAGFAQIAFCKPKLETHFPNMIDTDVLNLEQEPTPDAPHTLLMEATKLPCLAAGPEPRAAA